VVDLWDACASFRPAMSKAAVQALAIAAAPQQQELGVETNKPQDDNLRRAVLMYAWEPAQTAVRALNALVEHLVQHTAGTAPTETAACLPVLLSEWLQYWHLASAGAPACYPAGDPHLLCMPRCLLP
jgi:hypothetical protein